MDVTDVYQEHVVPDPSSPSGLLWCTSVRSSMSWRSRAVQGERRRRRGPIPPSADVPAVTLIVPRRTRARHRAGRVVRLGPVGPVGRVLGTREIDAVLALDRARNIHDFRNGLEWFDVGSQNFGYVDTAGHLAMFTAGEMPLREDLEAGTVQGLPPWFIRDGTGGNEWLSASTILTVKPCRTDLPPDEMPQLQDPPAGFFVNANNDPVGTTLDNDPWIGSVRRVASTT